MFAHVVPHAHRLRPHFLRGGFRDCRLRRHLRAGGVAFGGGGLELRMAHSVDTAKPRANAAAMVTVLPP